jgi:hypothetical protein
MNMFGKKAARIKELENIVLKRNDLEKYLPLAADIASRIDVQAFDTEAFVHMNLDALLQTAEDQARQRRFLNIFSRLPAEKRLEFLLKSNIASNDAKLLQAALDREIKNINALANLDNLLEKSRNEGCIDLTMIPTNSLVRFFLYTADDIEEKPNPKAVAKNCYSDIKLDARHLGSGMFSVINLFRDDEDTVLMNGFEPNRTYNLGTLMGEDLDTTVYFGASLHFQYDDIIKRVDAYDDFDDELDLKIGRIKLNKKDVFA